MGRARKRHKVLVLFDTAGTPPANQDFTKELQTNDDWAAEAHVTDAGCASKAIRLFRSGLRSSVFSRSRSMPNFMSIPRYLSLNHCQEEAYAGLQRCSRRRGHEQRDRGRAWILMPDASLA